MTVHRPHPITGPWPYVPRRSTRGEIRLIDREPVEDSMIYADPADAILYDGCDRCAQHAEHPMYSLDGDYLGRLWLRMVEVEKRDGHYRTATEAAACSHLYGLAILIERNVPDVYPWSWPWTIGPAVNR